MTTYSYFYGTFKNLHRVHFVRLCLLNTERSVISAHALLNFAISTSHVIIKPVSRPHVSKCGATTARNCHQTVQTPTILSHLAVLYDSLLE